MCWADFSNMWFDCRVSDTPSCLCSISIFCKVHHSLHKHQYFLVLYFLNLKLNDCVMMFNIYQMAQNVIVVCFVTSYCSWTSVIPYYFFRLEIRMHFGLLTSNDIQGLTEGNFLFCAFSYPTIFVFCLSYLSFIFNCILTCIIDLILSSNKASNLLLSAHAGFNPQLTFQYDGVGWGGQ